MHVVGQGSKTGGSIENPKGKIISEEDPHDCVTAFLIEPYRGCRTEGSISLCVPSECGPDSRSLSDIDRSTAANDLRPATSFSARKNPQRIPANTAPVFSGLRPRIWPHLICLVTKAMSDRLLGLISKEFPTGCCISHQITQRECPETPQWIALV